MGCFALDQTGKVGVWANPVELFSLANELYYKLTVETVRAKHVPFLVHLIIIYHYIMALTESDEHDPQNSRGIVSDRGLLRIPFKLDHPKHAQCRKLQCVGMCVGLM